MSFPNTFQNKSFINVDEKLQEFFLDIVSNVEILSNLCINHVQYEPLLISSATFNALQQLSLAEQDQYLRWRLGSYLCNIYGGRQNLQYLLKDKESVSTSIKEDPVRNTAEGRYSQFYIRLHENNSGEGYFDSGWTVIDQVSNEKLTVVYKDSLKLHVSERHLIPESNPVTRGEVISIRLPRNRLENGCYVAISNAGLPEFNSGERQQLVNLYFNIEAEGAAILMEDITTTLNPLQIPFTFRVPYESDEYEGTSAGTLTFRKDSYIKIWPLLKSIYNEQQLYFRSSVPWMTKYLAPGLALAENPHFSFTPQEGFSLNRFQIIAEGYIQAYRQGDQTVHGKLNSILNSFSTYHINLHQPYLNPKSKDCYT